jgi:hypothetical protein
MPKFTFICDHNSELGPGPKIEFTTEKEYLPEVLEDFEMFLRGCGFFFDGMLDFVDAPTTQTGCGGCGGCNAN